MPFRPRQPARGRAAPRRRSQADSTGNQPNAYAAIRNLVTDAFCHAGFANIAHARRYYGRNDHRSLTPYEYILNQVSRTHGHITQTRRGPCICR